MKLLDIINKKLHKKKTEVIQIDNSNTSSEESDNEALDEVDVIDDNTDNKEVVSKEFILKQYEDFKKNNERIDYEKNFASIYSFPFEKNLEFEKTISEIKEGLGIISEYSTDLVYKMKVLDNHDYSNKGEMESVCELLDKAIYLQRNLLDGFKAANEDYFGKLSMTSISVVVGKNTKEMLALNNNIYKKVLENNISLSRAYDNIFYHSGEKILEIVDKFVEAIKNTNQENANLYTKNYILPSDYIITLDVREWTTLYQKLKAVYNILKDDEETIFKLKKYFDDFESDYMIILLYEETKKLNKASDNKE